jgi:hypothetical protein
MSSFKVACNSLNKNIQPKIFARFSFSSFLSFLHEDKVPYINMGLATDNSDFTLHFEVDPTNLRFFCVFRFLLESL